MRRIIYSLIILISLILVVGCTGEYDNNQADLTDETVFTPPEAEEGIVGSWSGKADVLTINRYFYGNGQFVTFIQDDVGETWCVLGDWSQDGENVSLTDRKIYRIDTSDDTWVEDEGENLSVSSMREISPLLIVADEILPNGISGEIKYSKEATDMQIPNEPEINVIIDNFLGR